MHYDSLKKGYRIEYNFVQDEQLKYAQTPVFETKRELNVRLKELHEDESVTKAIVMVVKYFEK